MPKNQTTKLHFDRFTSVWSKRCKVVINTVLVYWRCIYKCS